jgi:hypothetical protein
VARADASHPGATAARGVNRARGAPPVSAVKGRGRFASAVEGRACTRSRPVTSQSRFPPPDHFTHDRE